MKQLLLGGTDNSIGALTKYITITGPYPHNTTTPVITVIPKTVTLSNFNMSLSTAAGSGETRTFTVYKNDVATLMSITFSDGETEKSDDVNTVDFLQGDTMYIKHTATGTPSNTQARWNFVLETNDNHESILLGQCSTDYYKIDDLYSTLSVPSESGKTESDWYTPFGSKGKLKSLFIKLNSSPGVGKSFVFTIRKNNVDTDLSVTISGGNASGSNTIDSIDVEVDDLVTIKSTPINNPSWKYVYFGLVFESQTINNFIVIGGDDGFPAPAPGLRWYFVLSNKGTHASNDVGVLGKGGYKVTKYTLWSPSTMNTGNYYRYILMLNDVRQKSECIIFGTGGLSHSSHEFDFIDSKINILREPAQAMGINTLNLTVERVMGVGRLGLRNRLSDVEDTKPIPKANWTIVMEISN